MFVHQSLIGRAISQVLIVGVIVVLTIPIILIIRGSFEGQGAYNYVAVLSGTPFLQFFGNSVFVALTTVVLTVVVSIAAAYVVATLRPRFADFAYGLVLLSIALPGVALIVPLFFVMQSLGLLNTHFAIILPLTALSVPFGVLLGTNHIRNLPREIYEAALIDGANSLQYLLRILLPLCAPILSVVAVFTFLAAWNEFLLPLIFIQDVDKQVLSQVPSYFQGDRSVDLPKIFAANFLISLPVLILYVALQRLFTRGLAAGAVK